MHKHMPIQYLLTSSLQERYRETFTCYEGTTVFLTPYIILAQKGQAVTDCTGIGHTSFGTFMSIASQH